MIRAWLWGITLVISLTSLWLAIKEPFESDTNRVENIKDVSPSDFYFGGIPVAQARGPQMLSDRDLLAFAPISDAPLSTVPGPDHQGANASQFPALSLDGILLRRGSPVAFVRYQGERLVLGKGDAIGQDMTLDQIDQDSVVLTSSWGESRRLYMAR